MAQPGRASDYNGLNTAIISFHKYTSEHLEVLVPPFKPGRNEAHGIVSISVLLGAGNRIQTKFLIKLNFPEN